MAWCIAAPACSAAPVVADRDPVTMEILNSAMGYIKEHHPDAAAFIREDAVYTADTGDKRKLGYSKVIYNGGGWVVSIGHAVTVDLIYDITADYSNGKIVWIGRSTDGKIGEDSYKLAPQK